MIAIVKYNAGNIKSVQNALTRLGHPCIITDDTDQLRQASKVIFPGVGEAGSAMTYLRDKELDVLIPTFRQPVLGICLGLQLMCSFSEEGSTTCLNIFDAQVKKFPATGIVPHIGWNSFTELDGLLFEQVNASDDVYFLHSYYAELCLHTTAVCDYLLPFSAAMQKDNFYATQFHPEKSAGIGDLILRKFLAL